MKKLDKMIPWYRHLIIKIILPLIALSCLVIIFLLFFLPTRENKRILQQKENKGYVLCETIIKNLEIGMIKGSHQYIHNKLNVIAQKEKILSVIIFNRQGKIFYTNLRIEEEKEFYINPNNLQNRTELIEYLQGENKFNLYRSIFPLNNNENCQKCHTKTKNVNGFLLIDIPLEKDELGILSNTNSLVLNTTIILILMITVTTILIINVVTKPINNLNNKIREAREKDFNIDLETSEKNEIGILANSINQTIHKIKELSSSSEDTSSPTINEFKSGNEKQTQDVYQSKQMENKWQVLQAIIDSMHEGIVFIDNEDKIVLFNESAAKLRNLPQWKGRHIRECHPTQVYKGLDKMIQRFKHGGEGNSHPTIVVKKRRFENTYAPVRDKRGNYLGTVLVSRDTTDKQALEEQLINAEKLAAIGRMSTELAHEIRNPLNTIEGAIHYLISLLHEDDNFMEYEDLIKREIKRLDSLTSKLLLSAKPKKPVQEEIDLNQIIKETANNLIAAQKKENIILELNLEEGLPSFKGDESQIKRVFENILENSIQAIEKEGKISVETKSCMQNSFASYLVIIIKDTGVGMDEEIMKNIFVPFYTTKTNGMGLGLNIVKNITESHNGKIRVKSSPGRGTVVTIEFSLKEISNK